MKTIDLGQKFEGPTKAVEAPKKWYPTIDFSDNGTKNGPSFDEKDIGKTMTVRADLKLVGIHSSTEQPKGKRWDYTLEVHKIQMGHDDMATPEEYKRMRQASRKT